MTENKKSKGVLIAIGLLIVVGIVATIMLRGHVPETAPTPPVAATPPTAVIAPAPGAPGAAPAPGTGAPSNPTAATAPGALDFTTDASGLSHATVTMNTTKGVIKFKFFSNDAPVTAHRFAELIQKKFYDGLTFHRVIPGFVAQGGDPQGNGTGGSGQHLKAEFNSRPHLEGSVAMARAQDPDSADSQFYICLGSQPQLDHQYTVFGQVVEGMDAVKKIQVGDKMTSVTVQ